MVTVLHSVFSFFHKKKFSAVLFTIIARSDIMNKRAIYIQM